MLSLLIARCRGVLRGSQRVIDRPGQQELIGPVPTEVSLRERLHLPADTPLAFHEFLPASWAYREDSPRQRGQGDASGMGNLTSEG